MSHRNLDPWPHDLEAKLRRELLAAAELVQPSADGLAKIRARIAAREAASSGAHRVAGRRRWAWSWAWAHSWAETARQQLSPGPGSGPAGWLGWLRPAAGLATALLIVTGGYWAISSLPQVISPSANSRADNPVGQAATAAPGKHVKPHRSAGGPSGAAPYSATPTPSCSPLRPSPGLTHSPSPSATKSATKSPAPSATTTPTVSAPPSGSVTGSPTPASPAPGTASPLPGNSPTAPPASLGHQARLRTAGQNSPSPSPSKAGRSSARAKPSGSASSPCH